MAIGFSFGRGSFQAVPARPEIAKPGVGLPEWTVDWAKPGSVDATFAAAGVPLFFLDLRPALREGGPVAQWLMAPHPWRMAGAVFDPEAEEMYYRPEVPGRAFEAVIFHMATTRARPSTVGGFANHQATAPGGPPRLGVQAAAEDDGELGVAVACGAVGVAA